MKTTDKYVFFWSGIYSNWYPSQFEVNGRTFSCAEQFFMFAKAMIFEDEETAEKIMATTNPKEQKKLGRRVKTFDEEEWTFWRYHAMCEACYNKFTQNPKLGRELLQTGDKILVEASPYDKVWGIGLGELDPNAEDESKWRGQNLLGQALMQVRDEIRSEGGV